MIFVDTGAWYASLVVDEPHHQAVNKWLKQNSEPLITTDYCLAETLNLLIARRRPRLAAEFAKALFEQKLCNLHFLTELELGLTISSFQNNCLSGWSFTDCTSKTVIDRLGIQQALALDKHFRQFGISVFP